MSGTRSASLLVPRARSVVGPGALRAPRIVATGRKPRSTTSRLRRRGLLPAPLIMEEDAMEVLYPRCAGLDVHKDTVVACVRCVSRAAASRGAHASRTTTAELLELADWLTSHGCTHVAMEATGVYWKPVWHVLEGRFELVLANAQHIRNVPGRKTDVNDAMWIADLLAHGLIRASFVPPAPDPGAARSDPHAQAARARDLAAHAAHPEDARGRQHQARAACSPTSSARAAARCSTRSSPARPIPSGWPTSRRAPPARSAPSWSRRCAGASRAHHRAMLKLHLGRHRRPRARARASVDAAVGKALGADPAARRAC